MVRRVELDQMIDSRNQTPEELAKDVVGTELSRSPLEALWSAIGAFRAIPHNIAEKKAKAAKAAKESSEK